MYNSLLITDLEQLTRVRQELELYKNTHESYENIQNKSKEIWILINDIRHKAISLSKIYLDDNDILRLNNSIKIYDDATHNSIVYPFNKLYNDEYIKSKYYLELLYEEIAIQEKLHYVREKINNF